MRWSAVTSDRHPAVWPGGGADLERLVAEAHDVAVRERQVDVRAPRTSRESPMRLPSALFMSHAPVTWSAWQWVSIVKTSFSPSSRTSAASRACCSKTGSIEHRLARALVGEEVRVRARGRVEELAEDHRVPPQPTPSRSTGRRGTRSVRASTPSESSRTTAPACSIRTRTSARVEHDAAPRAVEVDARGDGGASPIVSTAG